jgi:hypothetical protein
MAMANMATSHLLNRYHQHHQLNNNKPYLKGSLGCLLYF